MALLRIFIVFILGLFVINNGYSQSLNMSKLYQYDNNSLPTFSGFAYSDIWGYYTQDGKEIAFIGSLDSIHFFDVTPGNTPYQFDSYAPGGRSLWREFKTYKNFAYSIVDQGGTSEGLVTIDLQYSPDSIHYVGRDDTSFHRAHMLFVDTLNGHLFLSGASRNNGSEYWDLLMYDLNVDPSKPILIKKIDLPGNYVHDMFVNNDTVFCSHGTNGLYIYKVNNLGNYTVLGSITTYPEQGYNHSSWISPDKKYLVWADETSDKSLKLADVSDPASIKIVSLFRSALLSPTYTNSIAHNPYYRDSLIIVSYYHDGVQIWNGTDPMNPIKIAYYDTEPNNTNYNGYAGAWGVYPFFPSGNMAVSDITNGFFLLSIDAALPLEIIQFEAEKIDENVTLRFELNLSQFSGKNIEIQKSFDGKNFTNIASIIPSTKQDQFIDTAPSLGNNYYRLHWLENGKNNYSNIKVVKFGNQKNYHWVLQANKILRLNQTTESRIQSVRFMNLDKVIFESNVETEIQIPKNLPYGMYILQTTLENGQQWIQKLNLQEN
ncbi:MAG: choice-of-anchor B family protein [Saprospiraceae bacterium]